MIHFGNYPLDQLQEAARSIAGRLVVVVLTSLLGIMLGGVTVLGVLSGLWQVLGLAPYLLMESVLDGRGLVVLPLVLVFSFVSIRLEWPLRVTLLLVPLMWWFTHATLRWNLYDSPRAQKQRAFEAKLRKEFQDTLERAGDTSQKD